MLTAIVQQKKSVPKALLFSALIVFLVGVGAEISMNSSSLETYSLLAGLAVVTGAWPLYLVLHRDFRSLLSPFGLLTLTLFAIYVVRPLFLLSNEATLSKASPLLGMWAGSNDLQSYLTIPLALALLVIPIAYVSFAASAGWPFGFWSRVREGLPDTARSVESPEPRARLAPVVALTVIGLVGWILYVELFVGGLGRLLASGLLRNIGPGAGYPHLLLMAFGSANLLWFCQGLRQRRLSPIYWVHLVAFAAAVLVLGTRTYLAILLLSMLIAFCSIRRRLSGFVLLFLVIAAVTASTAFWFTRTTVQQAHAGRPATIDLQADAFPGVLLALEPFDFYAIAIHIAPQFQPLGGSTYVNAIFLPFKPLGVALPLPAGEELTTMLDPSAPGARPPTFIGEGYLNFGVLGLFGSAAALGIYVGLAMRLLKSSSSSLSLALASVVTAAIPYLVWSYATAASVVVLNFLAWFALLALLGAIRRGPAAGRDN